MKGKIIRLAIEAKIKNLGNMTSEQNLVRAKFSKLAISSILSLLKDVLMLLIDS
jgi:hypothetical protein